MGNIALKVRPHKTYRVVLGPRRDPLCCECHEVKARSKERAKDLARRRCPSWWVVRECSIVAG